MNGLALQNLTKARVMADGTQLTVTHPRTTQSGSVTTSLVYFRPQPLTVDNAGNLDLEGQTSAGDGNAYDFVTDGSQTVGVNDRIAYRGQNWRVFKSDPQDDGGVLATLHCYAVRD